MDIFDEIDSGVSSEKFLEIMELLNGKLEQRESNTNEDSDLDKFLQDTNYFSRLIHNNLDSEESVIKTIQLVEKIGRVARNNIKAQEFCDKIQTSLDNEFFYVTDKIDSEDIPKDRIVQEYKKLIPYIGLYEGLVRNEYTLMNDINRYTSYNMQEYTEFEKRKINKNKELVTAIESNTEYISSIRKTIIEFINDKDSKNIDNFDMNIFMNSLLQGENERNGTVEEVIGLFDILGEKSDFMRIANPTEERKAIAKKVYQKVVSYFEIGLNSIDVDELSRKIESTDNGYFRETETIEKLVMLMAINDSEIREKATEKIMSICKAVGFNNEELYYNIPIENFQGTIQRKVMENICKNYQFDFRGHADKDDSLQSNSAYINDYAGVSKDYLEYLIEKRVNIFSREGRVLRNYCAITAMSPEFDKFNIRKLIEEKYNLSEIMIEDEYAFLDSFINENPIVTDYDKMDELYEHLQLLKLKSKDFVIPKKYVDYIIKQALEGEKSVISNSDFEDAYLIESAIEDLGKHDLEKQGIDFRKYLYCVQKYIQGSNLGIKANGGAGPYGVMLYESGIRRNKWV